MQKDLGNLTHLRADRWETRDQGRNKTKFRENKIDFFSIPYLTFTKLRLVFLFRDVKTLTVPLISLRVSATSIVPGSMTGAKKKSLTIDRV